MSPEVIVVGLGAMGLSTCASLARRGVPVMGIEQFDIAHAMGSSHGATRIFRTAYFEHPGYVPLLKRSRDLWRLLEGESDIRLFLETPALYMGPAGSELLGGSIASALAHGITVESLNPDDIRGRYPQFAVPDNTIGVLEVGTAGIILAERSLTALARVALAQGAEFKTREKVVSWTSGGNLVRVITEQGIYEARQLIFCGGAWSAGLVKDLGLPLRATRQLSGWFWPEALDPFQHGSFPIWALETSIAPAAPARGRAVQQPGSRKPQFHYGFPAHSEDVGLKAACHDPGEAFDPDTRDRRVGPGEAEGLQAFLRQHVPGAAGQLLKVQVCMYTMTPDGHFIIDRHPRYENVHMACGFSGHGFKFAPVIGEVMADLATRGTTRHPVDFLSLKRFPALPAQRNATGPQESRRG